MKRRNFLVGVGSASIGGSAVLGTGAFSRIESDRAVTIAVAEDPNAYLGLDKCNTPNGSYAHLDDNGHLKIFMDEENPTRDDTPLGDGVNSNSTTRFDRVFQICNQGKEQVCVWIEDDDWPKTPDGEPRIEFYVEDNSGTSIIGNGNAVPVEVGGCFCVGMRVKTYGLSEGDTLLEDLDDTITIVADVDGCPPAIEVRDENFRLAYEDRKETFDDYDYNDFVVDVDAAFEQSGINGLDPEDVLPNDTGDGRPINGLTMDFTPQAKSAGDDHDWELAIELDAPAFPGLPDECSGDWRLTVRDENGTVVRNDSGTFEDGTSDEIEVFPSTADLFDTSQSIINGQRHQKECIPPVRFAELELEFDDPCQYDETVDVLGDPGEPHGQNLFFDPLVEGGEGPWGKGDTQLLVVPQGWKWPYEETHIASAYDAVGPDGAGDGDEPEFPDAEWRYDDPVEGEVFEHC